MIQKTNLEQFMVLREMAVQRQSRVESETVPEWQRVLNAKKQELGFDSVQTVSSPSTIKNYTSVETSQDLSWKEQTEALRQQLMQGESVCFTGNLLDVRA